MWVYGSEAIVFTYFVCRLRARYGVRFQSVSMSIVALRTVSLCVWALYMACSSASVSLSGWNSESARVTLGHGVLASGSTENNSANGFSE